jgi:predicted RNA-binding Zn-ribbon protein involved in translation (DUF1610 family)
MVSIVLSIALHSALAIVALLVVITAVKLRGSGSRSCAACGCRTVSRDSYIIYCPNCGRQLPRDAMISTEHHEVASWILFRRVWALMLVPFLLILGGAAWLVMMAMSSWR